RTVYAVCRQPFAADDGCVQDDRPTFRHQRKGLLNREENAFHINVENRIEEFLGDLTQSCVLCNACIGEDDVEFSFFVFDLREQPIRSPELETSARILLMFLPISLTAAANSRSRRPVMKT